MTLGKLTERGVYMVDIYHIHVEGDGLPKRWLRLSNVVESKRHKVSFYKNVLPYFFSLSRYKFLEVGRGGVRGMTEASFAAVLRSVA